jgi:hypothetical protein
MKIFRLELKYKTRLDVECTDTGTILQCYSTITVSHFHPSLKFAIEAGARTPLKHRLDRKYQTKLVVECANAGTIIQCCNAISASHFHQSLIFASDNGARTPL